MNFGQILFFRKNNDLINDVISVILLPESAALLPHLP